MKSNPALMGLTIILIVISVGISGCDTPTPISAIPSVIYYYEANETRIFVTGDLYMYEGINITINDTSKRENFTYGLTHSTNLTQFLLEVRISDNTGDDQEPHYTYYIYSANVTVEIEEDPVRFIIVDIHQGREIERESPYKTLMEKDQ